MKSSTTRRSAGLASLALVAASTLAACGDDAVSAEASELDTLEPGVIRVAIQPYAPYTSMEGNELTGLDSDILKAAAENLGLEVEAQVTDFNGMLGGVQSHRVDMSIGGIAWSEERQEEGLFTDPAYYSPPAMAVQGSETVATVADLENKDLGTVTGYVWVKSINAIEGAELHAYPDANGVFNDLSAGRIDVGFLDPLIIIDALKKRPDFGFETQYLTPPTADEIAANPDLQYLAPYQVSFYVAEEAPKLEQAISEEIRAMYENGELADLIEEYGGDPDEFLVPTPEMSTSRQGVDRPDDWSAPGSPS
jgi:polar amino acid transport system substrate-binding protein